MKSYSSVCVYLVVVVKCLLSIMFIVYSLVRYCDREYVLVCVCVCVRVRARGVCLFVRVWDVMMN
jgi:hypothetical protein